MRYKNENKYMQELLNQILYKNNWPRIIISLFFLIVIQINSIGQPKLNIIGYSSAEKYIDYPDTFINYYFIIGDYSGLKQVYGKLELSNLTLKNQSVEVRFVKKFFNTTYYNSCLMFSDNIGSSSEWLRMDTIGSPGIFTIELRDTASGNLLCSFDNVFIVLEKTDKQTIPSAPYYFLIYYVDDFFYYHPKGISHASTFVSNVKTSLMESWNKEVVNWDLCDGINKNGIIDMPVDNDSNYVIIIDNFYELFPKVKFKYHQGTEFGAWIEDYDRTIYIDCRLMQTWYANSYLISEESLLLKAIMHEFFHGIQWSHMSLNKIKSNFINSNDLDDELKNRMWLFEGQAKSFETVFMEYFRIKGRNEGYSIAHRGTYEEYCNAIMENTLDQNYQHFDFHHQKYKAALFWRYIYEHNYNVTTSERNRLSILKETCKAYDAIDTSNFTDIKDFMEQELKNANINNGGVFTAFDDLIIDFAEKVYFHDTSWVYDTGGYLNCWDDPNKENFYTMISSSIVEDKSFDGIPACNGKDSSIFDIRVPFMFRTHYHTRSSCSGPEKIVFNSDPYNTGNYARYHVNCYITDGFTLKEKQSLQLKNGMGELVLCTSGTEKIIIIVTRLDDKTTNPNDDYQIKIDGTISNPPFDFSAFFDPLGDPAMVKFFDLTDTAYFPDLNWNFGDGKISQDRNPEHNYNKSGDFNVILSGTLCKDRSYATPYTKRYDDLVYILPPFIADLTIKNATATGNAYQYTRTYNGTQFVFSETQNNPVTKTNNITISTHASLPLKGLKISLITPDAVTKFTSSMSKAGDAKSYAYLMPADSCKKGLNILQFEGIDSAGSKLINVREPQYAPVFIDSTGTGWDLDEDLITGGDIYPFLTPNPDKSFELYVSGACEDIKGVYFANNTANNYTIEFGDGVTANFNSQTIVFHNYIDTEKKYKVKVKNGSVVVETIKINFKKW
ncbi:MAG: PKD domain-containing protein [Bacteroidales bacterium]|nr:PKD domain-containing protein [Bacteroidales bacterium]